MINEIEKQHKLDKKGYLNIYNVYIYHYLYNVFSKEQLYSFVVILSIM